MESVAIVTGGSRGIGRATSLAAAKRGYKVVVGYASNKAAADEVVGKIEASNGKAIAVKCDVAEESDIIALFKEADKFGTLGALVNNGGIVGKSGVRVDEMSAERIERVMAVNVTGSSLCAREAVKRMSTKHGGEGGVIVNLMQTWFPAENRQFYAWQPAACGGWRVCFEEQNPVCFATL